MKDKNISVLEYAATLGCTAVIVMAFMVAMFACGAYAITKLFHMQWWQGVALFLLFVVLWARPLKRANKA